jgi:PKD repeat protein
MEKREQVVVVVAVLAAIGTMPAQAAAADFAIYDGAATSPVLVDPSYGGPNDDRDYRQVGRAVQDLRQDVAMVTGAIDPGDVQGLFVDDAAAQEARLEGADQSKVPALITEADDEQTAIIVGVVGESDLVDGIIDAGKFDEAAQIAGEWEAYATKQVDQPVPGVDSALVIAGSDARGTIYGIYSISEEIGVSPWYWYSDVPVAQQDEIVVAGSALVDDGPDVKYRGIFINDEERTIDWAASKFPTDQGTPEVNYYRHVFEMMLRLRLNTLWPAMHENTTPFNAATDSGTYDDGTPINAEEASEYGVVMSSSHTELMLRNDVGEWRPFYERNREALNIQGSNYETAFDYSINKPAIIEYWRERMLANEQFESILKLGMRGVHDGAPRFTPGNPHGFGNVIEMVGDAIAEQRNLVEEVYGNLDAVPQVFVPYKEMGTLYNQGLKDHIPGEVTVMWAEDNRGYLRQVPTQSEAARAGGNGVYYHSQFWGRPKSYVWLNSTPMALMVEQFHRAWNTDAGRYWILNVGDIKPGEMKTELFAKLAWDVDGYDDANIESKFLAEQVERDFGLAGDDAAAVTDALERFDTLESTKRPEQWGVQSSASSDSGSFDGSLSFPFSSTSDGDELQRYINEANELVAILEGLSDGLDEPYRSSFYQQILHRVSSYRNMAEQIGYYWKHQLAADQGRYASAQAYAELSKAARERIRSDEDYWDTVSDGKWSDAIGYSHPHSGNQGVVMLTDDRYANVVSPSPGVGANAEGQTLSGSGTLRFNSASPDAERFFDVFSRNDVEEEWVAEADAPWITLAVTSGAVTTEERVTVTVDWSQLDASATGTIEVYNADDGEPAGDPVATFVVEAEESAVDLNSESGHVEANGYVAIEAEHFAENVPGADGSEWRLVKRNAQRGDTMKAFPETAARVDSDLDQTAHLNYRVYFTSSGQFSGTFYRVPTLNEGSTDAGVARTQRTAIGLDDGVPASASLRGQSVATDSSSDTWARNVMRQIEPLTFTIDVPNPGWHELVVYRSDASIVFDRIIIQTVNGAVGDGLVGPVESPNSIAQGDAVQTATVASLPEELAAYRALPPVTLSVGETLTVDDAEDVVAVESDNETAASVTLDGDEVTVTGNRVGIAVITITNGDGEVSSFTVKVERADGPQLGAYLEEDELVVIDAADGLEASEYANAIDSNNGTHTWALARNGLQAVPVATSSAQANWLATSAAQGQALLEAGPEQNVNSSAAPGTPPRLEFAVDIENGGTYYLFVNSSNPNANADSYHVAVDGQWRYHSSKGGQETDVETWYGSTGVSGAALALDPGEHTISVWAREAGTFLNQIALTTSTSPAFTGFQSPSQRESLGANNPPVIDSVAADPDAGEAPLEVDFSVAASDPDGDELTYEWDFGDGGTSDEQNPVHTYEDPGIYEAAVTVSDGTDQVSASVTIAVEEASGAPAEVRAAAKPSKRVLSKRAKQTAFKVSLRNAGGTVSDPIRVCAKAPKRRLAVKGKRCRSAGSLEPDTRGAVRIVFRVKRAARGKVTRIRFQVSGVAKAPVVRVEVRR